MGRLLGVDEVGRGPLAGPVVAAAVALRPGSPPLALSALNDSKQLSERARTRLMPAILKHALAIGVGWRDAARIDEINILEATREAMIDAIHHASRAAPPDLVLVDGNLKIPAYPGAQIALIKGDARSLSIAAASVLAKVIRDRYMIRQAARFPVYGFEGHKGYGTRAHRAALSAHGLCPLHRRSFKWSPP
ncbi:ribonuclease HII [Myxococcota bacterium]|nr:ribonuclease HII [Myxococcota bacterium]MBU1432798.1 ribonuclease HII [Myxococcota bacterium]MBU1897297.1 ribonuclease HII [Myxococcota bacterium]